MNEQINTLDYYLNLPYSIKIHPASEGGYAAEIEELPGCITQAEEPSELLNDIEDAKKAWIATALEDGAKIPIPRPHDDYSGKLVVRMPRSLHRALSKAAQSENVSLNQLITYTLAKEVGIRNTSVESGAFRDD